MLWHDRRPGIPTRRKRSSRYGIRPRCKPDGDESDQLMSLISYFDNTYVNGAARHVQRPTETAETATTVQPVLLRRLPPLFPNPTWNVYDATLAGDDRTNNLCESWNRTFGTLLRHNHPSVWCAIEGS